MGGNAGSVWWLGGGSASGSVCFLIYLLTFLDLVSLVSCSPIKRVARLVNKSHIGVGVKKENQLSLVHFVVPGLRRVSDSSYHHPLPCSCKIAFLFWVRIYIFNVVTWCSMRSTTLLFLFNLFNLFKQMRQNCSDKLERKKCIKSV